MRKMPPQQILPPDTVKQLQFILKIVFEEGQQWIRSFNKSDWRRSFYIKSLRDRALNTGPSIEHVATSVESILGYLAKIASTDTRELHNYLIVKPEKLCAEEQGIALIRPVLKLNGDSEPQLNFHVWFHCKLPDHLMLGWRLEGPEGSQTTHNLFHAQPLRDFGKNEENYGLPDRFPQRFPTIPLPATNNVELCLAAVLIACGQEALYRLARSGNREVRTSARAFHDRIFGHTSV